MFSVQFGHQIMLSRNIFGFFLFRNFGIDKSYACFLVLDIIRTLESFCGGPGAFGVATAGAETPLPLLAFEPNEFVDADDADEAFELFELQAKREITRTLNVERNCYVIVIIGSFNICMFWLCLYAHAMANGMCRARSENRKKSDIRYSYHALRTHIYIAFITLTWNYSEWLNWSRDATMKTYSMGRWHCECGHKRSWRMAAAYWRLWCH